MSVKVHEVLRKCVDYGLEATNELELELFKVDKRGLFGRTNLCKECHNARFRVPEKPYLRKCIYCGLEALTEDNLTNFRENSRSKYGYVNVCMNCFIKNVSEPYYDNTLKMRSTKLRYEVLLKLGGETPICNHCGVRHPDLLSIDHINNDGAEERNNNSLGNKGTYRKILYNMTPEEAEKEYQILCRNCNWLKYLDYRGGMERVS